MLSILVGDGLEKKERRKIQNFLFGLVLPLQHCISMICARAVVTLYLKLFFVAGGLNDWQSG